MVRDENPTVIPPSILLCSAHHHHLLVTPLQYTLAFIMHSQLPSHTDSRSLFGIPSCSRPSTRQTMPDAPDVDDGFFGAASVDGDGGG